MVSLQAAAAAFVASVQLVSYLEVEAKEVVITVAA